MLPQSIRLLAKLCKSVTSNYMGENTQISFGNIVAT